MKQIQKLTIIIEKVEMDGWMLQGTLEVKKNIHILEKKVIDMCEVNQPAMGRGG